MSTPPMCSRPSTTWAVMGRTDERSSTSNIGSWGIGSVVAPMVIGPPVVSRAATRRPVVYLHPLRRAHADKAQHRGEDDAAGVDQLQPRRAQSDVVVEHVALRVELVEEGGEVLGVACELVRRQRVRGLLDDLG